MGFNLVQIMSTVFQVFLILAYVSGLTTLTDENRDHTLQTPNHCPAESTSNASEMLKNIVRRWWWSYVDVITGDISKDAFNENLVTLWHVDGIFEEPQIFRFNGVEEMLNGRKGNDSIASVLDGLLAFDINKLMLGDMYVEYVRNATAKIRAFKTLLHHNRTKINFNYETWIFCKDEHQEWKIQSLTIDLDTYQI